ncbi:hypothetical protein chiPu_0032722 [Chiloscyllium punctatum]|uniref:Uncharacterized protein n=1 Tax=Chiloscyllium punctatum TaxID=137246 RepID=A0A401U0T6_CHIPU|nr:hypothetical protein [Chiloscyllium punctatum]
MAHIVPNMQPPQVHRLSTPEAGQPRVTLRRADETECLYAWEDLQPGVVERVDLVGLVPCRNTEGVGRVEGNPVAVEVVMYLGERRPEL